MNGFTHPTGMLGRAGRRRELQTRAEAIHQALQAEQLAAPALLADAYGAGLLGNPAAVGVGGHPGQVHPPGVVFDGRTAPPAAATRSC